MRLLAQALQILKVALLVLLAGLLVPLLAGTLPGVLGYESFVFADTNMRPSIQSGDLVVVQPVRAQTLSAGDVITFRKPDDPEAVVTRRVLAIQPEDAPGRLDLQTRGDAEPTTESVTVGASVQLGRVAYALPHMGLLLAFVDGGLGRVLLLALPGVLLGLDYLRARAKLRRTPHVAADRQRIDALLARGQQALQAGYGSLALRAADGVLALEPDNLPARRLKRDALRALPESSDHVAA